MHPDAHDFHFRDITYNTEDFFCKNLWTMKSHTFRKAENSEKNSLKFQGRFTILINTNNTSNYQSTNETHHTQQNTTITTHK